MSSSSFSSPLFSSFSRRKSLSIIFPLAALISFKAFLASVWFMLYGSSCKHSINSLDALRRIISSPKPPRTCRLALYKITFFSLGDRGVVITLQFLAAFHVASCSCNSINARYLRSPEIKTYTVLPSSCSGNTTRLCSRPLRLMSSANISISSPLSFWRKISLSGFSRMSARLISLFSNSMVLLPTIFPTRARPASLSFTSFAALLVGIFSFFSLPFFGFDFKPISLFLLVQFFKPLFQLFISCHIALANRLCFGRITYRHTSSHRCLHGQSAGYLSLE